MASSSNTDGLNYRLAPGEVIDICPYDPSHKVRTTRMLSHLLKCRANYAKKMAAQSVEVPYYSCKYNYMHQVPGPELPRHQEQCPDRGRVIPSVRQGPFQMFQGPVPKM